MHTIQEFKNLCIKTNILDLFFYKLFETPS